MSKNVLIVDDSILTQRQLSRILAGGGYNVVDVASNGVEAVNKFQANSDSLVTLDITMPLMDGIDVLQRILKTKPDAKVVMVSSLGKEKTIKQCLMLGAKAFIVKPFNADKVVEILNSAQAN